MSRTRSSHRIAGDLGYIGAIIGLVLSIIWFVVLGGLSIWMDRTNTQPWFCGSCLVRTLALLGLTLGLGIGYMIGRSIGG